MPTLSKPLKFDRLKLTDRPIIGIVAPVPYDNTGSPHSIVATNVRWLQGSGARVVPIVPGLTQTHYRKLFECLNGLMIPGGYGTPMKEQRNLTAITHMFLEWSQDALDSRDDYFPIWGTCLGLQSLLTLQVLKNFDEATVKDLLVKMEKPFVGSAKIHATESGEKSRLMQSIPEFCKEAFRQEPIHPFIHEYRTPVRLYEELKIDEYYRLVATAFDGAEENLTAVESYSYPIYATMVHYEKTCHQWTDVWYKVDRRLSAIQLSQHFGNFFVQESCKNAHRFPSKDEEYKYLIDNYQTVFTAPKGWGIDSYYIFD